MKVQPTVVIEINQDRLTALDRSAVAGVSDAGGSTFGTT